MVLTDVRATVKSYLDAQLSTVNMGNHSFAVYYSESEVLIKQWFTTQGKGVLLVLEEKASRTGTTPSGPISTDYVIGVRITAVDKSDTDADILLWQAKQEVQRVIRENMVGSLRFIEVTSPENKRIGSTILYEQVIDVHYIQFVSAYGSYSVANRRFFVAVKQWIVGYDITHVSSVGQSSGLGPLTLEEPDPYIKISIPGSANSVLQLINNYDGEASLQVRDYEAITQLLYATDVSSTAGNQYAVSASGRTTIGYMAIVVYNTKIVNATDGRTSGTSTFTFTNARIGAIRRVFDDPASPWTVEFHYDSVTQTDA